MPKIEKAIYSALLSKNAPKLYIMLLIITSRNQIAQGWRKKL